MDTQAIRNAIAAAGLSGSAESIHAALTAPFESGETPAPFTAAGIMAIVSPGGFAAAFDHPRFSDLYRDVANQDRASVGAWALAFQARGLITADDAAAVAALLATTTPDTRSRAERAGLAGLAVEQVRRAQMGD